MMPEIDAVLAGSIYVDSNPPVKFPGAVAPAAGVGWMPRASAWGARIAWRVRTDTSL